MEGGDSMIDLCSYAVSVGEKSGADEIEAVWVKDVSMRIEAELGEISKAAMTRNEGVRIQVIKDKAVSSVFTYQMDKGSLKKAVEKALAAAAASKKDEHWDSLPYPGKYPHVKVWDSAMADASSEDLMEPVAEMLRLVPDDISVFLALNEVYLREKACVNSNGIEHEDRGTLDVVGMAAVGRLEDGVTPAFEKVFFMREYTPDPQKIAEPIIDEINLFKRRETASSGRSQVIISPQALEALLHFTLFTSVSGENVIRGKSLLAGKEGEKVASSQFTLHDNGIIPQGTASREMDDEGVPRQDTCLIEEGILHGFIWNNYWAKRTGVSSTGNAYYDDQTDELSIRETTMVVTPGDYTKEELLNVKDGYYVLSFQGAHGSNPESGDFSVVCTPAYRIRNGEIAGGVVGMMLSDNVFSLLQKIDAVGCDVKVGELSILPCIRFTDVNVVTK